MTQHPIEASAPSPGQATRARPGWACALGVWARRTALEMCSRFLCTVEPFDPRRESVGPTAIRHARWALFCCLALLVSCASTQQSADTVREELEALRAEIRALREQKAPSTAASEPALRATSSIEPPPLTPDPPTARPLESSPSLVASETAPGRPLGSPGGPLATPAQPVGADAPADLGGQTSASPAGPPEPPPPQGAVRAGQAPNLPVVTLQPPDDSPPAPSYANQSAAQIEFDGPIPVARALSNTPTTWDPNAPEVILLPDHGLAAEAARWRHGAAASGERDESGDGRVSRDGDSRGGDSRDSGSRSERGSDGWARGAQYDDASLEEDGTPAGVAGPDEWEAHMAGIPDAAEAVRWPSEAEEADLPRARPNRKPAAPAAAMKPRAAKEPRAQPRSSDEVSDRVADTYGRGMLALQAKDYATAADALQKVAYESADHHLADNALYWLAEVDYDQRRFTVALAGFRAVVDKHPLGNKVPDAMVKMGLCLRALGNEESARELLQQVVRGYPHTDAARVARERL